MTQENTRQKGTFTLTRKQCKACGICIAHCPKVALAADEEGKPFMPQADKCIHCSLCEMRCPDFAIRFVD